MEYKELITIDVVKKALGYEFKGEDIAKLLLFFSSLGALRNSYGMIVTTGSTLTFRTRLVKAVLDLCPKGIICINSESGSKCERALLFRSWNKEKILFLTDFHSNRRLITRFLQDIWTFSIVLKKGADRPITSDIIIPKMTIFTTASLDEIDSIIEKNALIVELKHSISQSKVRSEYDAYLSGEYDRLVNKNHIQGEISERIQKYLLDLDLSIKVEIPFEEIVRKYFMYDLERNSIYHYMFLELIKNITFFHQYDRDRYFIKESEEIIILSSFEDLKFAFEIGGDAFTRISQNLRSKYLHFLNFIRKWAKVQEDVVWFTRSRLVEDYKTMIQKRGDIPKTSRTYEEYLNFLVKSRCLDHKKEKNINWYKLKNTPSLKEHDLEEDQTRVNEFIERRVSGLKQDSSKEFYHSWEGA